MIFLLKHIDCWLNIFGFLFFRVGFGPTVPPPSSLWRSRLHWCLEASEKLQGFLAFQKKKPTKKQPTFRIFFKKTTPEWDLQGYHKFIDSYKINENKYISTSIYIFYLEPELHAPKKIHQPKPLRVLSPQTVKINPLPIHFPSAKPTAIHPNRRYRVPIPTTNCESDPINHSHDPPGMADGGFGTLERWWWWWCFFCLKNCWLLSLRVLGHQFVEVFFFCVCVCGCVMLCFFVGSTLSFC